MSTWLQTYNVGDYKVTYISFEGSESLLIPISDILDDDDDYIHAIKMAAGAWITVKEIHDLQLHYRYRHYFEKSEDRDEMMARIVALKTQSVVSLPEWLDDFLSVLLEEHKTIVKAKKIIPTPNRNRTGYVYLLKQVNGEHYKIGRTKNPAHRTKTLGVNLPFEITFECMIQCGDMLETEKQLHNKFSEKRIPNTEWFLLSDEDVAYIKGLAS